MGHFLNITERELRRARRYGHPLSLLLLTVDCVKPDGGTYAPAIYDRVLITVAERLLRFTRETDIIGRNADREFIFALPETDSSETQIVIERLQECVTGMPIQTEGGPIELTIRMADVTTNGGVSDLDSLIERTQASLEYASSGVDRHRKYDFQYNKWGHDDFY
jgi:diguanylate cyclase (GGDEF)-like protein